MRMKIIITLLVLILNSCSLSGNQNLLGDDFRLFKNTTAWPLAVAVDNEDTAEIGAPDKPCGEDARMLTQNCR